MSHQHFVSHESVKTTKQKWTQMSDLIQGLQRKVVQQISAFDTVLFFSGGIFQWHYVTADGSQCFLGGFCFYPPHGGGSSSSLASLSHTKNKNQINKPHFNYLTQKKKKQNKNVPIRSVMSNFLNFYFFVCFYQNKSSDLYKKKRPKKLTTGIQDFLLLQNEKTKKIIA